MFMPAKRSSVKTAMQRQVMLAFVRLLHVYMYMDGGTCVYTCNYDGPQAQRLQRLFLRNRKACVREILEEGDGRQCKVPLEQLADLFKDVYADVSIDKSNPPDWLLNCLKGPDTPEWNSVSITGEEVRTQLKHMPVSSAPGPDHLPYKVWKAMDPDSEPCTDLRDLM